MFDNETKSQSLLMLTERYYEFGRYPMPAPKYPRNKDLAGWTASWFWDLDSRETKALTAEPIVCRLLENITHALATSREIRLLRLGSDRAFCV